MRELGEPWGVISRQGLQARETLQTLLADRVDCTPVLVAGARGYAFTGDGTFDGLLDLEASTWPWACGDASMPTPKAGLMRKVNRSALPGP